MNVTRADSYAKRKEISSDKNPPPSSKKGKVDTQSAMDEKIQKMVQVVIFNHFEDAAKNVVWMSEADIQELYPKNIKTPYVHVANRIYQVALRRSLEPGFIGISSLQSEEIAFEENKFDLNGAKSIIISPYRLDEKQATKVKEITFDISLSRDVEEMETGAKFIEIDRLREAFKEALDKKFVVRNQELLVDSHLGRFKAKVKELRPFSESRAKKTPSSPFGLMGVDAEVEFNVKNGSEIVIQDVDIPANEYKCLFTLSSYYIVERGENTVFPIVLEWEKLNRKIMEEIDGKSLSVGYTIDFWYDSVLRFYAKFDKADRLETAPAKPNDIVKKRYQYAYKFSEDTELDIKPNPVRDMVVSKGKSLPAKSMCFEIVNLDNKSQVRTAHSPKFSWASVEELKKVIQEQKLNLVKGQKFYVKLSSGKFLVHLKNTEAAEVHPDDYKKNWKQPMHLVENTEIDVLVSSAVKVFLVDTDKPEEVKNVTFKVGSAGESVSLDDGFLALFSSGSKKKDEIVSDKDLRESSVKRLKHEIILNEPIKIKMKDGKKFTFTPTLIEYEPALDKSKVKHGVLAKVTEKSKMILEPTNKKLVIVRDGIDTQELPKSLEELGLGGLAEEFLKFVRLVVLSRGNLKVELEKRGVKPIKGLLLSGPPGTGKTTMARQIGKLLGCPEERITMITATEVFNKWVGGSEENVRELFKPAREASERHKDKTPPPLHVIVIDEIDAIAPKRGSDSNNKWRDTVLNQLLGEMDGLKQLDNILVIGMTNLPDKLDPAILRPGRFDVHIKFGIPDVKGRKEIFEIHAKKLKESKCLAADVDFEVLAKETDNFSGADVEGVVKRAVSYAIERLSKLTLSAEEFAKAPEGISTLEDFRKAIKEAHNKEDDASWKHIRDTMFL